MRRLALILVTVGLLAMPAHAQTAQAATLTTEETLRWQILRLQTELETAISQANACAGQLGQWRAQAMSRQLSTDEQALTRAIEAAHPGFTWDPKTGTFSPAPAEPTRQKTGK